MFIGSPYNLKNKFGNEQVLINDKPVTGYSSFPCLGVELDERMSWENHIDTICRKVGSGIGIIKRVKPLVPSETLKKLWDNCGSISRRKYKNYKIGRQEL